MQEAGMVIDNLEKVLLPHSGGATLASRGSRFACITGFGMIYTKNLYIVSFK